MADPPLLTRPFLLLVAAHFLQGLGFASMLLLPLYLDHLGASRAQVGLVMATAGVGALLARPLVAWSLDRVGRRPTLVVGTGLVVLGMALLALVTTTGPLVYAVRVVFGLGQGALFAGYFTVAADIVPEARRTEGIALFGISGLVPLALNGFVALARLDADALRWLYPVAALLVGSSLLFVVRLPEPPPHPPLGDGEGSVWEALRQRRLLPVWLATAAFASSMAVFMAFVTVIAEARGVRWPAAVWLPYAAGAVSVRLVGARLPDRLGPENLVAPAVGLFALALLLAGRGTTDASFLLAGLVGGLAHGLAFPIVAGQAVSRSPARWRGSVMSLFTAVWQAAEMVAPPIGGLIADRAGDERMMALMALAAAVSLLPWLLLERRFGGRLSPPGSSPPRGT
ncbi:MAG: MFS transporter [Planctomycetota bacterium]|nr:MFS transporter [Planctomycetota bacterium]